MTPPPLRETWFDQLEARGLKIDVFTPMRDIPKAYRTDVWWRKTSLARPA